MILEIVPKSFELAESGMFIIGEAKYKFKKKVEGIEIDSMKPVINLSKEELEKEFGKAKSVSICFKSLALQGDNSPKGIMAYFYSKVFEPQVSQKEEVSASVETLDVSESDTTEPVTTREVKTIDEDGNEIIQIIDLNEGRIKQCEELVKDCQAYIGRVYQYEVEYEGQV